LRFRSLDGRCPSDFLVLLLDAICGSGEGDDFNTEGVRVAVTARSIARGLELESVSILLEKAGCLCRIPIALTSTSVDLHLRSASLAKRVWCVLQWKRLHTT
jgi:hypothetical protein